jgi:hypothetical protein
MKSRFLLVMSVVCILAALILAFVVPIIADELHFGAQIMKWNAPSNAQEGQQVTAHIQVKNMNADGYSLQIDMIDDTIKHQPNQAAWEMSGNLLNSLNPDYPANPLAPKYLPGVISPALSLAPGETKEVTYEYTVKAGDLVAPDYTLIDKAHVHGYDPYIKDDFSLEYPGKVVPPVPEAAAGVLFGAGVLGLGGFVWIRRKQSAVKI